MLSEVPGASQSVCPGSSPLPPHRHGLREHSSSIMSIPCLRSSKHHGGFLRCWNRSGEWALLSCLGQAPAPTPAGVTRLLSAQWGCDGWGPSTGLGRCPVSALDPIRPLPLSLLPSHLCGSLTLFPISLFLPLSFPFLSSPTSTPVSLPQIPFLPLSWPLTSTSNSPVFFASFLFLQNSFLPSHQERVKKNHVKRF